MSERSAVQNPMLRYADQIGWKYLTPSEALRQRSGDTGLYLSEILESQLLKLNPGIVTVDRAADIMRQLRLLPATIEGNRTALAWMKGEHSIYVPEENRERNICLIDFDNLDANEFHVTDEWRQQGVSSANRADVVFLINGIPVAIAETKAAEKPNGAAEGIDQIRRYHRETPEFFIASQVFEVTELFNFFYGVTWSTSRKSLFNWKDVEAGNYERKIKTFFDRPSFLKLLKDYILFLSKDDELTKVILRQHQTRAVEKVIDRVKDPTKQRGLVWHTQGSGKTLTMITIAALLLRDVEAADKPTVLMIVDRNELESQLFKNITSYGITNFQVAQSKKELEEILARDDRGLVVSMIHKFDDLKANLNPRQSIVVLIDEAHRTTGGTLGTLLLAALPHATFIGFTGTPIDKLSQGKGTFKIFGIDDERGYLDKYSTAESIEDGTTVKLNYALAPSELRIDRETLEREFLDLTEAEGLSDPAELDAILRKAVTLKESLKAPDRVHKVAQAIANDFRSRIEPMGFKAFVVAVDREACALYKQALDQYLPPEYSQPVYSPAQNDSADLKQYYLTESQEKDLRKAFARKCVASATLSLSEAALAFVHERSRDFTYDPDQQQLTIIGYCSEADHQALERLCGNDSTAIATLRDLYDQYTKRLPKILIVTEKLLTGFDAPILYCLYLDKPMRDHVLLQAIARVNRPYEDDDGLVKPSGFVLDFVGIFEKLEKAFAFDSDEVDAIIQNLDVLKQLFFTLMREQAPQYLPLTQGWDDKAKEQAVEALAAKEVREAFFKFFRQLQTLYDILSPDADLHPFLDDYQALVALYGLIRNAYNSLYIDKDLTAKTRELLRRNTTLQNLELPDELHRLSAAELTALKQSSASDTVKVLNLRKLLATTVKTDSNAKPFLVAIGEQADQIAQAYEDRQIDTQKALAEFEALVQRCLTADAERQALGVDENTFAIHTVLKLAVPEIAIEQCQAINAVFIQFPDYQWNGQQKSDLRASLYKVVRPIVGASRMIDVTNALLNLQRT